MKFIIIFFTVLLFLNRKILSKNEKLNSLLSMALVYLSLYEYRNEKYYFYFIILYFFYGFIILLIYRMKKIKEHNFHNLYHLLMVLIYVYSLPMILKWGGVIE